MKAYFGGLGFEGETGGFVGELHFGSGHGGTGGVLHGADDTRGGALSP